MRNAAALARVEDDTRVTGVRRLLIKPRTSTLDEVELNESDVIYPDLDDQIAALREEQDRLLAKISDGDLRLDRHESRLDVHTGSLDALNRRTVRHQRQIARIETNAKDAEIRLDQIQVVSATDHVSVEALKTRVASIELAQANIGITAGIALMVGGSATFIYLVLSFLHLI